MSFEPIVLQRKIEFEEGPDLTFDLRMPTSKEVLQFSVHLPVEKLEDNAPMTPAQKSGIATVLGEAGEVLCSNFVWQEDEPREVEWNELTVPEQVSVYADISETVLTWMTPKALRSSSGDTSGRQGNNRNQRRAKKKTTPKQ